MPDRSPADTIALHFHAPESVDHVDDPIHRDLSAVALAEGSEGRAMFLSCDETAGVDRLRQEGDHWGAHGHFSLGEIFDLPAGPEGEMDIEGLDHDDGWLWVCGSHSLKRGKADDGAGREGRLSALAEVRRDPNRGFLARVPLVEDDSGVPRPVARDGERRARCVQPRKGTPRLTRWLTGDPILGPFLDLPSKENGLDIEGIAARGMRVWLGLRGPVIRQYAVILELEMKETGKGWLKPRRIDGDRRYRMHLLDLHGQGLRDIAFDGDDLLLLTGPVTAGDGRSDIWRWSNAIRATQSAVHAGEGLTRELELPYRGATDHPEGLARWRGDRWLVVYDSPAPARLTDGQPRVTADLWDL